MEDGDSVVGIGIGSFFLNGTCEFLERGPARSQMDGGGESLLLSKQNQKSKQNQVTNHNDGGVFRNTNTTNVS